MFKKIHVFDLDGVLVDTSHRYQNDCHGAIDLDHWRANSHKVHLDTLLPMAKKFQSDCANPEIYVVLCTAREYHPRDVMFIHDKLGIPNKLIMRPIGNNTKDSKLKRRELSRIFNLRQFSYLPRFLFEDNRRNIEACKHLFTRCFYIQSEIGA